MKKRGAEANQKEREALRAGKGRGRIGGQPWSQLVAGLDIEKTGTTNLCDEKAQGEERIEERNKKIRTRKSEDIQSDLAWSTSPLEVQQAGTSVDRPSLQDTVVRQSQPVRHPVEEERQKRDRTPIREGEITGNTALSRGSPLGGRGTPTLREADSIGRIRSGAVTSRNAAKGRSQGKGRTPCHGKDEGQSKSKRRSQGPGSGSCSPSTPSRGRYPRRRQRRSPSILGGWTHSGRSRVDSRLGLESTAPGRGGGTVLPQGLQSGWRGPRSGPERSAGVLASSPHRHDRRGHSEVAVRDPASRASGDPMPERLQPRRSGGGPRPRSSHPQTKRSRSGRAMGRQPSQSCPTRRRG